MTLPGPPVRLLDHVNRLSAILLLTFLCGCSSEPFAREPLPEIRITDANLVEESFAKTLPDHRVTFDETVIIQAPFRDDLALLGELVVDRPAGRFQLVGLNHAGVTLFELTVDANSITIVSAIPPLMEHKDILLAIGKDIWRMYFELIPAENAKADIGKQIVSLSETTPEGKLIYEFGGDPIVLLDKHLQGWFGAEWRVRYFQYTKPSEGIYPHGIVMDNSHYHYRIIVKNRAMQ